MMGGRFVPLVFITGHEAFRDAAQRGYQTGAVDYIIKPMKKDVIQTKARVFSELDQMRRTFWDRGDILAGASGSGLWERGGVCPNGMALPLNISPGWLAQTLGYGSPEEFGGNWEGIVRADCLPGWDAAYRRLMTGEVNAMKVELVVARKDGSDCHLRAYLTSAPFSPGLIGPVERPAAIRRVFGQLFDLSKEISEKREADIQRGNYVYGAKMATLNDVSDCIAHATRDPIFMLRAGLVNLRQAVMAADSSITQSVEEALQIVDAGAADIETALRRLSVFHTGGAKAVISLVSILDGLELLLFDRLSVDRGGMHDNSVATRPVGINCVRDRLVAAMLMVFDTVYDAGLRLSERGASGGSPAHGLVRVTTDFGDSVVSVLFSYSDAGVIALTSEKPIPSGRLEISGLGAEVVGARADVARRILAEYDGSVSLSAIGGRVSASVSLPLVEMVGRPLDLSTAI